jgi:hypothetical protein
MSNPESGFGHLQTDEQGRPLLVLGAELDLAAVAGLRRRLLRVRCEGAKEVIVDVGAFEVLDFDDLKRLFALIGPIEQADCCVLLKSTTALFTQVLRITQAATPARRAQHDEPLDTTTTTTTCSHPEVLPAASGAHP